MSILRELEKLNISDAEIQNMDQQSLIRTEKLLKAEVRSNPELDINQVEKILELLKEHKREFKTFFLDEFKALRHILTHDSLIYFKFVDLSRYSYTDDFKAFLEKYFEPEIEQYINRCITEGNFRALNCILNYVKVFSFGFTQLISDKLLFKMEYCYQCIEIDSKELKVKAEPVMNLFFYRSLNQLQTIHFDHEITKLINLTVERLKKRRFLYRVLYAMGDYSPLNENLKSLIDNNKKVAYQKGVRVTFPQRSVKVNRGETYLRVFSTRLGRILANIGIILLLILLALAGGPGVGVGIILVFIIRAARSR